MFYYSPFFDDIYYCGEVKEVHINELKKQFPSVQICDFGKVQTFHQTWTVVPRRDLTKKQY